MRIHALLVVEQLALHAHELLHYMLGSDDESRLLLSSRVPSNGRQRLGSSRQRGRRDSGKPNSSRPNSSPWTRALRLQLPKDPAAEVLSRPHSTASIRERRMRQSALLRLAGAGEHGSRDDTALLLTTASAPSAHAAYTAAAATPTATAAERRAAQPPRGASYMALPQLTESSVACRVLQAHLSAAPVATYLVRTVDGYLISLLRLPRPRAAKVVFFCHGLLDSASAWIAAGSLHGLAARAYHAGYDVYLGNLRGSNDSLVEHGAVGANPVDLSDIALHSETALDVVSEAAAEAAGAVAGAVTGAVAGAVSHAVDAARATAATITGVAAGGGGTGGGTAGDVAAPGSSQAGADATQAAEATAEATAEAEEEEEAAAAQSPEFSPELAPLRGRGARAHSVALEADHSPPPAAASAASAPTTPAIASATGGGGSARIGFVTSSRDGIPVHTVLHPRQTAYWQYTVQDHALDTMAFVDCIRAIKQVEAPQRRYLRQLAAEHTRTRTGGGAQASHSEQQPQQQQGQQETQEEEEVRIVACGHSMGGAVLLQHLLVCKALQRPHGLTKLVLLSPAGLHESVPTIPRLALRLIAPVMQRLSARAFPARHSAAQRIVGRLLDDLKRSHATGEAVSAAFSVMLGGERHGFVFKHVSFAEYPIGGSSTMVLQHGVQNMRVKDFRPFDYGAGENERRYGTRTPPSFRVDFGLLDDTPMTFLAGELDQLIPVSNLAKQVALLNLLQAASASSSAPSSSTSSSSASSSSHIASLRVFTAAGHLDFTLGHSDDLITTTLREIDAGFCGAADAEATMKIASASGSAAAAAAAAPREGAAREAEAEGVARYLPQGFHSQPVVVEALRRVRTGYHTAVAVEAVEPLLPPPPPVLPRLPPVAADAVDVSPHLQRCIQRYPWLCGFSKIDLVLHQLSKHM